MAIITSNESGGSFDNLGANNREAQGFLIPYDISCTSVSFKMSKGSTSSGSTIKISIYSGTENGTLVKEEDFSYSLLQAYNGSTTSWTEFVWTTPVNLYTGTTYFARLAITGSGGDEIRRSLDSGNNYPDGTIWFNGSQNTSYDMLFRVSGSSLAVDVTVNATVIAATFSLPASTQSGGALVSPNVLEATFSLQSATELIDEYFTPAQPITASFSIPTVNIITPDAQILATVLTATFSIPTATPSGSANVDASVQTGTFSIPTVSFVGSVTISPDAQVATFSTPAPTIFAVGNVSVSASVLEATFNLQSPTVTAEQNAMFSAGVLSATFSVQTPTITAIRNVDVSATVLSATFSIPTPLRKVGGLWTAQPRVQGVWTPQPRAI